jgi:hypothetical protein
MGKKQRTPAQLAADKARSEQMKAKLQTIEVQEKPEEIATEQGTSEILAMVREIQDENKLLRAAILGNQQAQGGNIGVDRGKLVGEVEKYLVDPANYPDPTPRLQKEPRLIAVNFLYNYELTYDVSVSSYETKTGINMKEPKFTIQLNRIVLNDQGAQTAKRYIARRLIFHEDPQAAIVIARDNGLEVNENDQKAFLNEMRYLRVRDWLFDVFWPKPAQEKDQIREEVIGGTIVQVFTKNSEDAEGIPFDELNTKVQT